MKTVIHQYSYNIDKPEDAEAWRTLKADRAAVGSKLFDCIASGPKCPLEGEITFDLNHVFNNQWNTIDEGDSNGWRVFDFYQSIVPNHRLKRGHWLEITDEMQQLRATTYACGYCGHQHRDMSVKFCNHCIESEYLKESDLHLLRYVAIDQPNERAKLSDEERTALLPDYVVGQKTAATKKLENRRLRIEADLEKSKREYEGMLWLIEHGWTAIDNVIFYGHKGVEKQGQFCFGWQEPLTTDEVSKALGIVTEFQHAYLIKGHDTDGKLREWEGY